MKLEVACNGVIWDLTMNDVCSLVINLLSVSKMYPRGYRVQFTKDEGKVLLDASKTMLAIDRKIDGLYKGHRNGLNAAMAFFL